MNAAERKALLAILHDGDLLAAIDYVEGACKSSKPKASGPAPLKLEHGKTSMNRVSLSGRYGKGKKGNGYAFGNSKVPFERTPTEPRLGPAPAWSDKVCPWLRKPALAVAPCGCTLYPDTARQCAACVVARSPDACRVLIAAHDSELTAFDKSMGFKPLQGGRDFMINPHNGYYGERDVVGVA